MTEEEKLLVEMLNIEDTYIENSKVKKVQYNTNEAKILFNLIDKQQKEIECLNVIHESYKEMIEENNYISKDKIREKIEQLEIVKNTPVKDNSYTYKECIEYGIEELKELLEE